MKHVKILSIPFLHIDQKNFVALLDSHIEKKEKAFVITANPEVVMRANEDSQFKEYTKEATYICADGIGVVKAAKILGNPLPERVTGYDTMIHLLKIGNEKKYKIFLLGAQRNTLMKTVQNIQRNYPNVEIVGYEDGYFNWEENDIVDRIVNRKPDLVFVALGVPRQEKWICENINHFSQGVFIGVGGSFDVIAGTVKRAPVFWQKLNLEWFYRLITQPTRIKRMLALPRFATRILKLKYLGK